MIAAMPSSSSRVNDFPGMFIGLLRMTYYDRSWGVKYWGGVRANQFGLWGDGAFKFLKVDFP